MVHIGFLTPVLVQLFALFGRGFEIEGCLFKSKIRTPEDIGRRFNREVTVSHWTSGRTSMSAMFRHIVGVH